MNSDDYRVQPSISIEELRRLNSPYTRLTRPSVLEQAEQAYLNHRSRQRHEEAKKHEFIKLYQSYRIQHPTTTHEVAVEYVREVMADSNRIKFDWVM